MKVYKQREEKYGKELTSQLDRWVSLSVIDTLWMEHLDTLDDLREGIGLRGYAQRDPLVEYKAEAFSLFEKLMATIDYELVHRLFKVQIEPAAAQAVTQSASQDTPTQQVIGPPASNTNLNTQQSDNQTTKHKIGRNDPCPCGSGLKYKKCGLISAPQHRG